MRPLQGRVAALRRGRERRSLVFNTKGEDLLHVVKTRETADVDAYGWTPEQFIREQLLQRLRRLEGDISGAVVVVDDVPPKTGFNPDRLAEREPAAATAGAGHVLDRVWREEQGPGRTPLRFVVLDELNKYAPARTSPRRTRSASRGPTPTASRP